MRIYLTRHGETDWNRTERMQGSNDIPLNQAGIRQSENLADCLAGRQLPIQRIYTSRLSRAEQTARIVGERLHAPIVICPGLEEMYYGDWQGKTFQEMRRQNPEEFEKWVNDPLNYPTLNGESYLDIRERFLKAIYNIAAMESTGDILVVTHGALIMTLMCYLTTTPMKDCFRFAPQNVEGYALAYNKEHQSLSVLGRFPYIE